MIVTVVENEQDKKQAYAIRKKVFVDEQNVPPEKEIDQFDESDSVIHLLGTIDSSPVAVSRIRFVDDYAKLERIAVLEVFRGKKLGAEMVKHMEKTILNHQCHQAVLNAQTHAEDFYKKLGYSTTSDIFMDAGMPHVTMKKMLKKN